MSIARFFHSPLPTGGQVDLADAEARHASNVLRLSAGTEIVLFDGQGGEARAIITCVTKRAVQVEIVERTDTNRELAQPLQLLVALPKGDRQKVLVDGLVQLGTTQLTPLSCARGVAQPTGSALERLERSVIESCKQCGRNQLLSILPPQSISELVALHVNDFQGWSLLAHPYGQSRSLREIDVSSDSVSHCPGARVAIGPEGGFTDSEVAMLLDAGWTQVALGPRVLRIEYAALQVAAWWAAMQS